MRNAIIGIVLLTVISPCQAQPDGRPLTRREIDSILDPQPIEQAAMSFGQQEISLGTISEDDPPRTAVFRFTNRGDMPLVVTQVRTTCGCLTAAGDRRPVLPGDSASVRVTFDPDGHPGKLLRKVFVYTNISATAPTARLTLTGEVRPTSDRWRDYPHTLGTLRTRQRTIAFRRLPRGGKLAESIVCANSGNTPLRLSAADLPPYMAFRTEPEPIGAGESGDLIFVLDGSKLPDCPLGTISVPVVLNGVEGPPAERTIQVVIDLR